MGGDGSIYAANQRGQVLKVDKTINIYTWIGDPIPMPSGWGDAIVGLGVASMIPETHMDGATLFLELISAFIGLQPLPIVC